MGIFDTSLTLFANALSLSDIVQITCLLTTVFALLIALKNDAQKYQIPNWVSYVIIISYGLFISISYLLGHIDIIDIVYHALTAIGFLFIGFILFVKKLFGAGDVKLMSAFALWVGPSLAIPYLFLITIVGGIVALVLVGYHFAKRRFCGNMNVQKDSLLMVKVPYAFAIVPVSLFFLARIYII